MVLEILRRFAPLDDMMGHEARPLYTHPQCALGDQSKYSSQP